MVPETTNINLDNIQYEQQPTKTYRFDLENKRIIGWTDNLDAYAITAQKNLATQRYAHMIYNGDYGFDKSKFIGQDFDYIKGAIERELNETLSQDDRFQTIENFIITQTGLDSCTIKFNIVSTEGTVPIELEV